MTGLEVFAQRLEKRIQKIREKPDPSRTKANILFYESQLERVKSLLEEADKPLADSQGALMALVRSMGFRLLHSVHLADELGMQEPEEVLEQAMALGFPDYVCDRTITSLPAVFSGEMPKPQIMLTVMMACDPICAANLAQANQLGIPIFLLDVPFEDDYKNNLGYVVGQLKAFIKFAEAKVHGVKYDEDRFAEWIDLEAEYYGYWRDIYQQRKRVPCPDHPRDVFRDLQHLADYPNPAKMLQWAREYRDELREKADRGFTPVGKEKLRVVWTETGPFNIPVWEHLAERGVSMIVKYVGQARRINGIGRPAWKDTSEYGRKLNPLEDQARMISTQGWGGTGSRWVDDCLYICRDAKVDAIINFDQVNCTAVQGLDKLLAEAAERELGIPTLNIQSRQMFTSLGMSKDELYERLDDFIDMCLQRKGYQS